MRNNGHENPPASPGLTEDLEQMLRASGISVHEEPGKYAETALAACLSAYVEHAPVPDGKQPAEAKSSRARDFLLGTDLVIDDPSRCIGSRRLLRLDFTVGFTGKDNMPLITPTAAMSLTNDAGTPHNRGIVPLADGDYMRFGIRTGNARYGFDQPVVVAGICSSRQLDPGRIRENIRWLNRNVMSAAPEIIRTAQRVMDRFDYMTDPLFKSRLDARNRPETIRKHLPVLVGNWAYLDQQAIRLAAGKPRVCLANVADPLGRLITDPETGMPKTVATDVPWGSPKAYAAVAAMLKGPRTPPTRDRLDVMDRILRERARRPGQGPPIVVDMNGTPLEKDARGPAIRALARTLGQRYENPPGNHGGGPYRGPEK